MVDELHVLSERLSAIAEEIADLVHERLRHDIEAGAKKPSAQERRLARARRSVEKAAHLLREEPAGSE